MVIKVVKDDAVALGSQFIEVVQLAWFTGWLAIPLIDPVRVYVHGNLAYCKMFSQS